MPPTPSHDPRSLRALAHPLRVRLLDLLRFEGPATASTLARRVGESSGSTSYHLRQLARYGFIEEEDRPPRGRERWWRHRERIVSVGERDADAGTSAALGELLAGEARAIDRFLADPASVADWEGSAFFRSRAVRLSPAGLRELGAAMSALIDSLPVAESDDGPPDAVPVRLLAIGFPQTTEEDTDA